MYIYQQNGYRQLVTEAKGLFMQAAVEEVKAFHINYFTQGEVRPIKHNISMQPYCYCTTVPHDI